MKDLGVQFTLGADSHHLNGIGNLKISLETLKRIDGFDNLIDLRNLKLSMKDGSYG